MSKKKKTVSKPKTGSHSTVKSTFNAVTSQKKAEASWKQPKVK